MSSSLDDFSRAVLATVCRHALLASSALSGGLNGRSGDAIDGSQASGCRTAASLGRLGDDECGPFR